MELGRRKVCSVWIVMGFPWTPDNQSNTLFDEVKKGEPRSLCLKMELDRWGIFKNTKIGSFVCSANN